MSADDNARLDLDDDHEFAPPVYWDEETLVSLSILGPEPRVRKSRRRGLLENEVPLRLELSIGPASILEVCLGIECGAANRTDALLCLVANLHSANAGSSVSWVFYSRDKNHYARAARLRRYTPRWYSHRNVLAAVDQLERAGLIEHRPTPPSRTAKYRSRLRATPALVSSLKDAAVEVHHTAREVIVLRDAAGRSLDYPDSRRTCAMRRDVEEHNRFLSDFAIHLQHPDVTEDVHGFLALRGRWIDPRRRLYRRIFNGDFSKGGRWCGPWWQQLPREVRSSLQINNETVVELDYRACHLRLLSARHGLVLPFDIDGFDPFDIAGFPRQYVKKTFNIMLNANSQATAMRAVAEALSGAAVDRPHQRARGLMHAVGARFPELERSWCTGIGLKLQCTDSDICSRVQRRLRRDGIPALSLHDSFIVPVSARGQLKKTMDAEMDRACRKPLIK